MVLGAFGFIEAAFQEFEGLGLGGFGMSQSFRLEGVEAWG